VEPRVREIIKAVETRHSYELNSAAVLKVWATFVNQLACGNAPESLARRPRFSFARHFFARGID
jgi:hypothetical protein